MSPLAFSPSAFLGVPGGKGTSILQMSCLYLRLWLGSDCPQGRAAGSWSPRLWPLPRAVSTSGMGGAGGSGLGRLSGLAGPWLTLGPHPTASITAESGGGGDASVSTPRVPV